MARFDLHAIDAGLRIVTARFLDSVAVATIDMCLSGLSTFWDLEARHRIAYRRR